MKYIFFIYAFALFFYSCSENISTSNMIVIQKDWSVLGLQFGKATIADFRTFANSKNITFKVDTIGFYPENDSIAYGSNDDRLGTKEIVFSNEKLGLRFIFLQENYDKNISSKKARLDKYEITNFSAVKFENGMSQQLSQNDMKKIFTIDSLLNSIDLYEAYNNKNQITAGIKRKNKDIFDLKIIIGSKKI